MPQLSNPKHEAFCRALADGLKSVDAYEIAGYARSPSAASQLRAKPEIGQRVAELVQERQAAREEEADDIDNLPSELNKDWLLKTLMKNVEIAQRVGQIAPANKAVEMLAELIGYSLKKPTAPLKGDEEDEEKAANDLDLDKMSNAFEKLAAALPPKPKDEAE